MLEGSLRVYANRLMHFTTKTQDYIEVFVKKPTNIDEDLEILLLSVDETLEILDSDFQDDLPSIFGRAIDELERITWSKTFSQNISNKTYSGKAYSLGDISIPIPAMRDVGELLLQEGGSLLKLVEDAWGDNAPDLGEIEEYDIQDDLDALGGGTIAQSAGKVPDQELAPATFSFVGSLLRLEHKTISSDPGDEAILAQGMNRLAIAARRLIVKLKENTNCDRRLIDEFEELAEDIEAGVDVIALGMQYRSLEMTAAILQDELSNFIIAKIQGFGQEVTSLLAQSPDWRTFAEKADASLLPPNAEAVASNALDLVIDQLDHNGDLAHPEVPETLKLIRELIRLPKRAGLRVVYGAIRSVENLAKAILTKAQEEMVNAAYIAIASVILSQLNPVAAATPWLAWILRAQKSDK